MTECVGFQPVGCGTARLGSSRAVRHPTTSRPPDPDSRSPGETLRFRGATRRPPDPDSRSPGETLRFRGATRRPPDPDSRSPGQTLRFRGLTLRPVSYTHLTLPTIY